MENRTDNTEYFLIAYPDKYVMDKILNERRLFNDTFDHRPKQQTDPHVVVTSFFASEGMETTLVRWLQKICSHEQGFSVTINNYSGYPDSTIFLRIPDTGAFQHFAGQLAAMKDFISPSAKGLYRRPHIAIAANLSTQVYERALSEYSRKLFNESFQVKEMVLLKRKDRFAPAKTIQVFGLLPEGNDLFNIGG